MYPRSCLEAQNRNGSQISGIFTINPRGIQTLDVYCDEDWTVVQRRKDGSENFKRGWLDYSTGFGDLAGEFWIGNHNLHVLTRGEPSSLLVELQNANGDEAFALYNLFRVAPTEKNYRLMVDNYVGTAGDALGSLNGALFSTYDKDNDRDNNKDCADDRNSAWWYKTCDTAKEISVDLNGFYSNGILWHGWSKDHLITSVTMKIRHKRGKSFFLLLNISGVIVLG